MPTKETVPDPVRLEQLRLALKDKPFFFINKLADVKPCLILYRKVGDGKIRMFRRSSIGSFIAGACTAANLTKEDLAKHLDTALRNVKVETPAAKPVMPTPCPHSAVEERRFWWQDRD